MAFPGAKNEASLRASNPAIPFGQVQGFDSGRVHVWIDLEFPDPPPGEIEYAECRESQPEDQERTRPGDDRVREKEREAEEPELGNRA